jgi:hypothetical protein
MNVRTVKVECLDELLDCKDPTFIKIDVEGFEADVLAGAERTLRAPSLLAIETEGRQPKVVESLERAGFTEYSYDPWSRRLVASEGLSSNGLYLRFEAEVAARLVSAPKRKVLASMI